MNEESGQRKIIQRIRSLAEERKKILSLPSENALDRILNSLEPIALVHSFPEVDFHYLIQDIGPEDSLPLLALASDKQLEYILDQEAWERDRIDRAAVTRWLDLLLRADSEKAIQWILREKKELVEIYLNKNLQVIVREHDQDPSDFGSRFFTLDDTFYIRILDDASAEEEGDIAEKARKETIRKLLTDLSAHDYFTYQKILLESVSVIPAELEEETYRLRNVRLAEKGFLPFEEAIGVYQPLTPAELKGRGRKHLVEPNTREMRMPVPLYPVKVMESDTLFSETLRRIRSEPLLEQLQSEFAGLCNRIIVSDQKKISSREELKEVVKKVGGYLSIGLKQLEAGSELPPEIQAEKWIRSYPLSDIFRVGFGTAVQLKWRVEKWLKGAWFRKAGLPLSFWGEQWLGVLGGLLIKRPLYFENFRSGELYREFASVEDVHSTAAAIEDIAAFDDLLSRMDIRIRENYRYMTHKSMLLTLWARHYLGLSETFHSVSMDEFKRLFGDLFEGEALTPDIRHPRRTRSSVKEGLLKWLSERSGTPMHEISRQSGNVLEALFQEVESELGSVSSKDLDPKYIHLFIVREG
ncbi:MAG: hypothetical protein C4530_16095 [Desulfobacteraceae bacterium]|nr:MAG: hypothetical protein C4530_16095 [Desulfobacteraceae bacterium]